MGHSSVSRPTLQAEGRESQIRGMSPSLNSPRHPKLPETGSLPSRSDLEIGSKVYTSRDGAHAGSPDVRRAISDGSDRAWHRRYKKAGEPRPPQRCTRGGVHCFRGLSSTHLVVHACAAPSELCGLLTRGCLLTPWFIHEHLCVCAPLRQLYERARWCETALLPRPSCHAAMCLLSVWFRAARLDSNIPRIQPWGPS